MKTWQKGPDNVLLEYAKMTALMGFCFGVGLLASSIIGVGPKMQLAETISYTGSSTPGIAGGEIIGITNNTVTPTTTTSPAIATPVAPISTSSDQVTSSLVFTSTIPPVVTSDFRVMLSAVSVQNPRLVIKGLNINKIINLEPISQDYPVFTFLVRLEQLPVGRYELVAKGYLPTGTVIEVVGPRFEKMAPTIDSTSGFTSTSTGTNTITKSATNTITEITEEDVMPVEEVGIPELDLIIQNQAVYNGFVPARVRTSVSLHEAFIYVESSRLSTPRFVGKAQHFNADTLMLVIDTNQIPNGEYRMYAVTKLNDITVESEKRRFIIDNSATSSKVILNEPVSTTTKPNLITEPITPVKPAVVEPVTSQPAPVYEPPKEVVKIIDEDDTADNIIKKQPVETVSRNAPKTVSLSDTLKTLVPLVLKEHEREINDRLKTFGDDIQTGDVDRDVLRKKVNEDLMLILLDDPRLRFISTEAKKLLLLEVERLVGRAERVELLIKEAQVDSTSLDEAIKTFSEAIGPVDSELVDTSSPREFGLMREDVLKIESVSPIVSTDVMSTTTKIYTEIRGRAIPKSLVTLYIYSTPVMVTVRADDDGTFLYVYEKDLEDGDHEVYVALTTTEGEVVVKSPGFQFIREAQAFTTPTAENGDSLVPATAGTPLTKNPYFIVLSITLLVVSFIFILLGFKARKRSDDFTAA